MGRVVYTLALLNRSYSRVHNDLVFGYYPPQFLDREWMGVVNVLPNQAGLFTTLDAVRSNTGCSMMLMTKAEKPYVLVRGAEGPRVTKAIEEFKMRLTNCT
jgi:hypothetical protein